LFEATKNASGINFDKYDDIPVQVAPPHIKARPTLKELGIA
jgi:hypothetical protein